MCCCNVAIESTNMFKHFSTNYALKLCRREPICKIFATNITLEGFFASMSQNMPIKVRVLCETLSTNITFEGFFSSMSQNMPFNVRFLLETLGTNVTFEGVFSSMSQNMPFNVKTSF